MNKPPFRRSYWVVPGKLLAGCYPGGQTAESAATKINGLVESGVTTVINLMEEGETNRDGQPFSDYLPALEKASALKGRSVIMQRHPIVDGSTTSISRMEKTLEAIDAAISWGRTVYVHCWGGRGRTGSVIGCWLIQNRLATQDNAIAYMHELIGDQLDLFQPTPENPEQCMFVRQWRNMRVPPSADK